MTDTEQKVSIHAKKYYKVILEEIDPNRETRDSFTVKLAIRTRMTLPRAKGLVRHLPRSVRKSITAAEANRLKAVLEDIGGRARVESYLVMPGEGRHKPPAADGVEKAPDGTLSCRDCGTPLEKGAAFCPFCHRRFRDERSRPTSLEDRIPDDNPLQERDFAVAAASRGILVWVKANPIWVVGAAIILLLLLLIIK